jgi:DNA-binding IscR family transcriptional regulator
LLTEADTPEKKSPKGCQCLVEKVMVGAERHLHQYLQEHTIQTVMDEAFKRCNQEANKK